MKRWYNGSHMIGLDGNTLRAAKKAAGYTGDLSRVAKQRLRWFDYYREHDRKGRLTCRYFGISPQTFYRWKRRYNPEQLSSLEDKSHRPQHVRRPTWSQELEQGVLKQREEHPRWGKDKLVVLLRRQGIEVSTSMVGRILSSLKRRGLLIEPITNHVSAHKRQFQRSYATRKPKDYQVTGPGDLVQVDTLDIRPVPGVEWKHFTAHDVVSRWDVLEAHTGASAKTAAGFLDAIQRRMPFPVKAIQVDGGSEFMAQFETECQKRSLKLFVLPPRSPKLNGGVERAHRTHTEEFYEVADIPFEVAPLNQILLLWEAEYNTYRPHQALNYLTPREFLECYQQNQRKEVMCH